MSEARLACGIRLVPVVNCRSSTVLVLLLGTALVELPARAQGVTHVQAGSWMETDFLDNANPGCSVGVDGSQPGSRMVLGVSRRRPDPANLVFRQNSWTIRQGLPITILATFDATPMRIEGTGSGNSISVDLSGEALRSWVHNLTAASTLRLTFIGGTTPIWTVDLTGSSTVVNAMGDCVRSHQLVGVSAPFSLALNAPSAPPVYAPSLGPASPPYVPSSPLVPGGGYSAPPDEPTPATPAYVPSSPILPGGGRIEPAPSPSSQAGSAFAPSADPVFATWSGSSNMQTRPFHADGPWELQWTNPKGFFAINVHPLHSDHSDLVVNTTNASQSSHFYPDGGDFYLEVESSNGWQIRAVSVGSAAPSTSAPPPVAASPPPPPAAQVAAPTPTPPIFTPRPAPTPTDAGGGAPSDEAAFIAAVQDSQQQYNAAGTDFARGAVRPARKEAICRALRSPTVSGWVGKIAKLSTNGDGKGVVEIEIAHNVRVETTNNNLSDSFDHTLIEPNSPVYRSMASLREGQTVRFFGTLLPNDTDCVEEISISLSGSMTDPEFLFRFSRIDGL